MLTSKWRLNWKLKAYGKITHSYSDEMKTKIGRYRAENGNSYAITKILPCKFAILSFANLSASHLNQYFSLS